MEPDSQQQKLERLMRIQSEAKELDLAVTIRCKTCGEPLTAATSLSKVQGPVCRAKK